MKTQDTHPDQKLTEIDGLTQAGKRAEAAYQWEQAVEHYTTALELLPSSPTPDQQQAYDLLERRAYCYDRLADYANEIPDLERMVTLAEQLDDPERTLEALTHLSQAYSDLGQTEAALELTRRAVSLSAVHALPYYQARALYAQAYAELASGEYHMAEQNFTTAMANFACLGAKTDEAWCAYRLAFCAVYTGANGLDIAHHMQALIHGLDNRLLEARSAHIFAILTDPEPSVSRAYLEKSLELYQQIREQSGITSTLHNLGVFYFDYGLYERAYELFNRAAQLYPPGSRAYLLSLHNHAWAGFFAGINPDEILAENLKVNSACKAAGISDVEAFSAHVRGMMLYYLSKYEDADLWFATGVALFQKLSPTFLQVGLAWLGRNALARGDVDLALQHISAAMELAELQPDLTDKRIPLWFGYLAHQAAAGQPDKPDEDIWQLLDRAANLILSLGDKLQDAGLRRNYLIRSFENQDILYEWARQRQKRGVSLDCLNAASQVDEAIRDPFKRLVGFGTRLTSQRSLNELPAFIMAEFIELSGAERAYLTLFDENGAAPRLLETSGLTNEEAAQLQAELAQAVDQAVLARQPVLRTGLGEVPPGEPAPLHLRSALVLPLVLPERVIGVLVADVRDVFGPFTRADADLLGVLANQAAAALENALLVENLEARVAARTIELNARVDELQILNSIQSGLASRLEFKAIVDLVGDLLTEIFPSHIIGIGFYDAVNDTMDYAYSMVEGQHRPVGPRPAIGFSKKVIETGETLVVNENMKAVGEAVGSKQLIKTRYPQSAVFVPLRSGGQVTGVVSIQDLDHEHVFTPEIVQLLESLANSMSVGLENARLFAETQKLLEETEQRNAELAIINSIQQGLVARLDYQGIIDLVGDELMKIFNADTAFIAFHDRENELIDARYYVDKGVRQPFTRPYGIGFAEISIETGEPLLFGTSEASKEYGAFSVPSPGSEEDLNQSVVGVPIYSSGEAIGAVSVQSYQQNAYDQDDVRLLSTLANSMSLALESARLFEETQKLLEEAEQRNAELAILNSVGEAMAKSLDVDTIARLVGDKVQNFLKAPMVNIALFDEPAGVVHIPYTYDDGEHLDADDFPMGVGLAGKIYASRKPLRLNTMDELIGLDAVVMTVDGVETDPVNSWLGVPIIVGEKIIGGVSVQSLEKYAFSERDEHLLVTLAANMGVALENARLFNETQRLLKETEQRNAELAVINAVQEALAAELNIEGIFEAVGEKLREIFSYQTVAIYNADLKAGVMHSVYTYEKGQRFPPQSVPMNSLYRHIIELKDTLVFNQDFRQFAAQFEDYQVPQGEMPNSLVVVPVGRKKDADSIIYLTLQDIDGEKIFSEDDVRLLETLANSMSVALENAHHFDETQRLLDETEQRNAELALINSIQGGLVAKVEMDEIYRLVGDQIREIFNAQVVTINYLKIDERINEYRYVYEKGEHVRMDAPFVPLLDDLLRDRQTMIFNRGVEKLVQSGKIAIPAGEPPKSFVVMPLFAGKQVNGYISLQNLDMEGAFHPADVRLLETIGNSLSIALENARHFDETQRLLDETRQRNAELAVINSVQHGLATHLDMQSIYELVGEQVREIFASDTTMIAFYDRENKIFDMPYYADREMRLSGKTSHGSGLAEIAIETGKPLLCGTKEEWSNRGARHIPSPGSEEDLNESVLFVPVFRRGEVTGVISVQSYQQHAYDEGDVRLMTTLANSMSVALENARLFAETQRLLDETAQRAAELATVNTVNRALAAEMDLDSLIQLTGEQMRITFNADIVYVALLEPATGEIKLPYTFGEQPTSIRMGQGLTSKILETGQPLLINKEIKARREQLGATQVGREAASYLGVPVIVGKQPIGVISVQSTEEEDRFTENDVRLLSTLAANVAIAISNARLFEEVSRQKKYYEMIIANSPAAIVVINNQFIVTSWNPAAERLFGYTVEEAVGQNVDSLVANLPEINPEAVSFSHRGLQEKQFHFFSKRTRKDSSLVDVEAMGLPVIENGIITSYIVIYHDITELERARREAIEANQAKSTFLANMSHELRTPLNAIIGFTRIVRRKGADQLPEKQLENLDKVLVSADHLLGLINTVLDIAKIEAGRLEVQLSTFELTPLVELVINTTQPLVRSSRVKLSAEVAPDLGPVRTDLEKLKQILLNLLSNAAKFTHHGRIQLKARREAEMLVVDVADTGIGMGPEALQRVFDEFQQADSSTTREYGGTGLGLSISRSLTELLGGELSAVSEAGVGSTFTLRLPLQPAQEADEPEALLRAEQPGNGAAGAPVQSSPARERPLVLVIDDQPNAVDLLRENLEEAGYRVAFAYSGQQGIKLAVQLQPAAITLDVMMPTKDGWQVLHELKANPDTRRIPVILITVVDNKPLGFRLGAADYLVKPLDEQQVLDSLAHLSSRAGGKKPSCLLVVDDDPDVRVWVQQILENSRYEVRTAADGEQALAQIQEEMPEAILLDLVMPNMDGFSLIERLRSQPETQAIPIIVFTAKDLTAAETDALNSSVTAVIHKQGLPEQVLLQQITAAMEPSQVKGE